MSLEDLSPPRLIQTQEDLQHILPKLGAGRHLAVDTESNSLHAYQEQVCLIQFSTEEKDYLVDPLAIDDLQPLASLLSDPGIQKIYHAAEYDIMTLKRDFGFEHENIFDTYIAARTLGWDRPGLANILERVFGVKLRKRFQRANWAKRPLPEDMLNYARLDTHYLIPLREHFAQSLREQDRWIEALEASEIQKMAPPHPNGFDPEGFWDLGDTRGLSGQQTSVLRELYLFRENEAEERDVPPFKVLGNRTLLQLAEATPADRRGLSQVKGMSGRLVDRYGEQVLSAIGHGLKKKPPTPPSSPRTPDEVRDRYERLRNWRKHKGRERGVDSDLILPRDVLWDIAYANPTSAAMLRELLQPMEWRFQQYGEEILGAVHP